MSVKHVGIMTMHRINNYGSFLQAYALKQMLEQTGFTVQFVDIEVAQKQKQRSLLSLVAGKIGRFDRYWLKRMRYRKSRSRIREILAQQRQEHLGLDSTQLSAEGCDAVVIGSDEIFTCDSKGEFRITSSRFGRVPGVSQVITYAASCGQTDLRDTAPEDMETMRQGLECLSAVSVRDENTARVVEALCVKQVQYHLDPVLVYDFKEELEKVSLKCLPSRPYMVVYAYHNRFDSKEEIGAIRAYAREKGLKVVSVGGSQAWCDEYAVLTPFEVLQYFRYAECVVTDTFHGAVMCAKFQKPFVVFVRESNGNKLDDLLGRLTLTGRKVTQVSALAGTLDQDCDWEACSRVIEAERKNARLYLRRALEP